MASLAAELRTGHFPSYENPYAAFVPNVPFDASMMASMVQHQQQHGGPGTFDFLTYADQLLNSFAAKGVAGQAALTTEGVLNGMKARDLMEQFLPEVNASFIDTNALMSSGFIPTDFLPAAASSHLHLPQQANASSAINNGFGMAAYGAGPGVDLPPVDDHAAWFSHFTAPPSSSVKPQRQQQHAASSSSMYVPHQQALPVAVKRQEWRLCVKAPTLGTFYLFTDPEKSVGDMVPDIESKIHELYHTSVSVHLVQDDHGIDLPFSFPISSVLEDRALICVQYVRAGEAPSVSMGTATGYHAHAQPQQYSAVSSTDATSSPARSPSYAAHHSPHSSPSSSASSDHSSPQSPFLQSYASPHPSSGSMPATPCSQGEGQPETGVRFQEPPPTKVLQNKEFSFTVSIKGLRNAFTAFSSHNTLDSFSHADNDMCSSDSGAFFAPISASTSNNPWGAPVPMPLDDAEDSTSNCLSNCDVPIEILVEEEGGGILDSRDYRIRCSVLDKQEGLYVFFVRLKKNSHYGRTRFIIKIRRKQPTKQERNMDYSETNLMHNHFDRDPQMKPGNDLGGGARADLLVSHPIVVISKERKTKRKRGKAAEHN